MDRLRLAHLSDLHFGFPTFSLTQFLSKRWIGNLNLALFRRRAFTPKNLAPLPGLFEELDVDRICFTGDFTSTALEEEFEKSLEFLNQFRQPFFVLPGNHDAYTKKSESLRLFYDFFPQPEGELGFSLREDRIYCKKIKGKWWWIALDCAVATPPFNAYGVFSLDMKEKLQHLLDYIPEDHRIILGNHFPLFSTKNPQNELKNGARLRALLKNYSHVKLYLHGHIHKPYIINKMKDGYPLVLNSGSSTHVEKGGFYLIDLVGDSCHVEHYFFDSQKGWSSERAHDYLLT